MIAHKPATSARGARSAAEGACHEHLEARDGEPLRARERATGAPFPIGPAVSGAGIEQHGHDHEIDHRAHGFVYARATRSRREPARPVNAACTQMTVARMERDVQIGIVFARHGDRVIGDIVQSLEMKLK